MTVEKHVYESTCDACQKTKSVTLDQDQSNWLKTLPEGWEGIFVQYQTMTNSNTVADRPKEQKLWLCLCENCRHGGNHEKLSQNQPVEKLDKKWFLNLFKAGKFSIGSKTS